MTTKKMLGWSTPQQYEGHGKPAHGTQAGYNQGCRCLFCNHPDHRPVEELAEEAGGAECTP